MATAWMNEKYESYRLKDGIVRKKWHHGGRKPHQQISRQIGRRRGQLTYRKHQLKRKSEIS